MKIIFFILFSSIFGFSYSQTVLLDEDFESYQDFTISNIGSWQTLDLDLLNTWTLDGAPAPLKQGVSKDEAEALKKQLEEAGAEVELK